MRSRRSRGSTCSQSSCRSSSTTRYLHCTLARAHAPSLEHTHADASCVSSPAAAAGSRLLRHLSQPARLPSLPRDASGMHTGRATLRALQVFFCVALRVMERCASAPLPMLSAADACRS
jgi:hypothetical protein